MDDQIPNTKQSIRRRKSFEHHQSVLVPYEQDAELILENSGIVQDVEMTKFAKQPQNDGSFNGSSSPYNHEEGKLKRSPSQDSLLLSSYTQNLRYKLDDIERQQANYQGSSPKLEKMKTKDYMEYPKKEKGTLNEKITKFFTQANPTTIDFSSVPINDPQVRGVNWGASGPPATLGIGAVGVQKAPKEVIQLQQRQERLLSKSSISPTFNHGIFQSRSTPTLSPNKVSKQSLHGPLSPPTHALSQYQGTQYDSQESMSSEQDFYSLSEDSQSTPPPQQQKQQQQQSSQKNVNQNYDEDLIQLMKRLDQIRSELNQIV